MFKGSAMIVDFSFFPFVIPFYCYLYFEVLLLGIPLLG